MPIDPILFKKKFESPAPSIVAERVMESDYNEAKANVVVKRILETAESKMHESIDDDIPDVYDYADEEDRLDDEGAESEERQTRKFSIPPREHSGLTAVGFVPDESQIAAVNMLLTQQYGCMIGQAGTGKTTTQRLFLHKIIYGDEEMGVEPIELRMLGGKQGISIALCAFTGIATQVIKENMPGWLHPAVKTIHSLLEYAPVSTEIVTKDGTLKETTVFMPSRHSGNKLDHTHIIIDEASMVGVNLWHELLDACRPGTCIFLCGDLNQLPPVMSDSMFAYALSAWPVAELTHIHRQKEPAANKIIDVAHSILQGKEFKFDDAATNPNWRVIGLELKSDPDMAAKQIIAVCNQLRTKRVHSSVDPATPLIYDPVRDRIITAGNGFKLEDPKASVQQYFLNENLSQIFVPSSEENPRVVIDAGRSRKVFAVGYRIMATKNEPPSSEDRVTNGMVGIIQQIDRNMGWSGNPMTVGTEAEVNEHRKNALNDWFAGVNQTALDRANAAAAELEAMDDNFDFSAMADAQNNLTQGEREEGGGPASHKVTVKFANGAVRVFASKTSVDSLQLAYASTCHKCQGSQMDTAIIVVHHAVKFQLSREWFYTAVTRATKRVVLLYTPHGIRCALAKQRIFGSTLKQKIQKYIEMQQQEGVLTKAKVRLQIER